MLHHMRASVAAAPGLLDRLEAWLDSWLRCDEPIEMIERRCNFLPQRFCWRGVSWRVRAVVHVWERPGRLWRPARRYFEVVCGRDARFVLVHDVQLGAWYTDWVDCTG